RRVMWKSHQYGQKPSPAKSSVKSPLPRRGPAERTGKILSQCMPRIGVSCTLACTYAKTPSHRGGKYACPFSGTGSNYACPSSGDARRAAEVASGAAISREGRQHRQCHQARGGGLRTLADRDEPSIGRRRPRAEVVLREPQVVVVGRLVAV